MEFILASYQNKFQEILPKFTSPLKTNFENYDLWLRFGLTLALSKKSPSSALQAYIECIRINQDDPLPAMLAAKLALEDLCDPEKGLDFARVAIDRCNHIRDNLASTNNPVANNNHSTPTTSTTTTTRITSAVIAPSTSTIITSSSTTTISNTTITNNSSSTTSDDSSSTATIIPNQLSVNNHGNNNNNYHQSNHQLTAIQQTQNHTTSHAHQSTPSKLSLLSHKSSCCYKNIAPLLSKCYLLASVMHAHIHEQKPESIRIFDMLTPKQTNLEDSQRFLDLAKETHENHLVYFHKALHEAKQRSYKTAIDNLHRAIELNPHHLPTVQLLILSLSAIKLPHEALVLCESILQEFEDNLLLLYVKCNLEQCLVETKGYKSALATARHIMKCIKQVSLAGGFSRGTSSTTTATLANSIIANNTTTATPASMTAAATLTAATAPQSTTTTSTATATTATLATTTATTNTNTIQSSSAIHQPATPEKKESSANLFSDDVTDKIERVEQPITDELSVWLLVAEIFIKIGSIDDAESCVDEGSIYANGALSHRVMFVRGLIAKAKNNLIEAKAFFQSCLALCPRHAKALQQLAHVHYLLGNYSTAEKFLRDSIEIDDSCSKSWDYMRLVHIEQNQLERAKKCEQEFEALSESSPVIPISAISRLTLT